MAFYVDTSALVKLVVAEPQTEALRAWFAEGERNPVACDLVRTELLRTIGRVAPDRLVEARTALQSITLLRAVPAIFDEAGRLDPADVRSFDAIHLAAALDLGDDLEGLVTYDKRLASAAVANGINVISPT